VAALEQARLLVAVGVTRPRDVARIFPGDTTGLESIIEWVIAEAITQAGSHWRKFLCAMTSSQSTAHTLHCVVSKTEHKNVGPHVLLTPSAGTIQGLAHKEDEIRDLIVCEQLRHCVMQHAWTCSIQVSGNGSSLEQRSSINQLMDSY